VQNNRERSTGLPARCNADAASVVFVAPVRRRAAHSRFRAGLCGDADGGTETAFTIDLGADGTRTVRRTTTTPVRNTKAHRPRKADHFLGHL
jgi:hypothetical protein